MVTNQHRNSKRRCGPGNLGERLQFFFTRIISFVLCELGTRLDAPLVDSLETFPERRAEIDAIFIPYDESHLQHGGLPHTSHGVVWSSQAAPWRLLRYF